MWLKTHVIESQTEAAHCRKVEKRIFRSIAKYLIENMSKALVGWEKIWFHKEAISEFDCTVSIVAQWMTNSTEWEVHK